MNTRLGQSSQLIKITEQNSDALSASSSTLLRHKKKIEIHSTALVRAQKCRVLKVRAV